MKVLIPGYSKGEPKKEFDVKEKEEITTILDELDVTEISDIWEKTYKETLHHDLSGNAYAYIDARTGEIKTSWLQSNTSLHPFDSFYEIVLCSIETPVFKFDEVDLLYNAKEMKQYEESQLPIKDFIIKNCGEKDYRERVDNAIIDYKYKFRLDRDNIKDQMDKLYK